MPNLTEDKSNQFNEEFEEIDEFTYSFIKNEQNVCANNYHPIPVVLKEAKDVWVFDVNGKKYLDCLAAYSSLNHGHLHPRIVNAAKMQLEKLSLTSRAFHNDKLGEFLKTLCEFAGFERALPMNTGAEAVETGIKIARRWGYEKKKVEKDKAEIIVCHNNFHGRTTTIVGFSDDDNTKRNFGPFTPGFKKIPFNDINALKEAINENTIAFMVEPIQGEAGVIIPRDGYLKEIRQICKDNNVLLILDEIQTGFGRTGKNFAFEHENAKPDILLVGKALGGGILPVSAVLSSNEIMSVITPGSHGSTFGGNPLAAAVGMESINVLVKEELSKRSQELGAKFLEMLRTINSKDIKEIRGKGLMIAIEFNKNNKWGGNIRPLVLKLMNEGILVKGTHDYAIRITPPLTITEKLLKWAATIIKKAIES